MVAFIESTGLTGVVPSLPMRTIYVEWIDSSHGSGWTPTEEAIKGAAYFSCITVGFVLVEDDKHLTVTQTHTDDNKQVDGVLSIPKVAITKRKWL